MKRFNAISALLVFVLAVLVGTSAYAQTRCPTSVTCRGAQRLFPKSTATNSFEVLDSSGTATLTITTAGVVTFAGAATHSSTLAVTGNFSVNTSKFTVAAASGNTLVAGTLNVTGAADLASTLALGGDVTFDAGLAAGADITMAQAAAEAASVALEITGGEGGDGATTTAGKGGAVSLIGGAGGATFTDQDGADGGDVNLTGGAGIDLNGAGSNDGDGGDVILTGGASSGTGTGIPGMVKIGSPTVAITPAVGALAVAGAAEFDSEVTFDGDISATGTNVGWTAAAGANTACDTTCGAATCFFGFDAGTTALVDCSSALADTCICD
jgi:Ca2+-binding RTX toxin-like protein